MFSYGVRAFAAFVGIGVLVSCGPAEPVWAPDAEVQRAVYRDDTSPTLTLFTVVSRKNGFGAHSSLLVNAPSQRLIFDPAGTFKHPHLPERNDVHFGMSDKAVAFYIDYHARVTYDVIEQEIPVSPAVAELALQKVMAYGAVPKAQCTNSITDILAGLPGFENVPQTWYPTKLSEWVASLPDVRQETHKDESPESNDGLLLAPALLR